MFLGGASPAGSAENTADTGGAVCAANPMGMNKATALGLAAVLLLLPLSATHAQGKKELCEDRARWSYDETRLVAAFAVDLPRCWGQKDDYKIRAAIERSDPASARPTKQTKRKMCRPDKACRIRVPMDHPSPEGVSYRLTVQYLETPNRAVVVHRSLVCKSSAAAAGCIQI